MRFNPFFHSPIRSHSRGRRLFSALLVLHLSFVDTLPNYPYHKSLSLTVSPLLHTHTHKHTALTLLCSPFPGDLNKLLENCIQQSPGNPHSTTNTPFLLPYTPVPLRALFPTEFFQSNTQVNTHAHRNFFPLLNCGGEQRSSG